ncbi:hypothetical protein HZC33_03655 [Candidatus Wolfebacteria bacterium]|nr:hypothetical protein [Candidatus Wolfebacteria bacterium]
MAENFGKKIDPSSDVEIRTMKSDVEAIRAAGGDITLVSGQAPGKTLESENRSPVFKISAVFVIILIIIGIGFLAYYLALKMIK